MPRPIDVWKTNCPRLKESFDSAITFFGVGGGAGEEAEVERSKLQVNPVHAFHRDRLVMDPVKSVNSFLAG